MKIFNIIYSKNGKTEEFKCTKISLDSILDKLKTDGAIIIDVIEHKKPKSNINHKNKS